MNWEKVAQSFINSANEINYESDQRNSNTAAEMHIRVLPVIFAYVALAIKAGLEEDMFREVDE